MSGGDRKPERRIGRGRKKNQQVGDKENCREKRNRKKLIERKRQK